MHFHYHKSNRKTVTAATTPTHVKNEPDEVRISVVTDDDLVVLIVLGV